MLSVDRLQKIPVVWDIDVIPEPVLPTGPAGLFIELCQQFPAFLPMSVVVCAAYFSLQPHQL
mgnify:CR=1 FL=1